MATRHLSQYELAERWNLSYRTLERWRGEGIGPAYFKLGNRIGYRLEEIEIFEQRYLVQTTGEPPRGFQPQNHSMPATPTNKR